MFGWYRRTLCESSSATRIFQDELDDQDPPPSDLHGAMLLTDRIRHEQSRALQQQEERDQSQVKQSTDSLTDFAFETSALAKNFPSTLTLVTKTGLQTPGLLDGLIAAGLVGLALLPVRKQILKRSSSHVQLLMDLILSSSHVLASIVGGLYVGSVMGCRPYLQDVQQLNSLYHSTSDQRQDESSLLPLRQHLDDICKSDLVSQLLQSRHPTESSFASHGAKGESSTWLDAVDPRVATLAHYNAALESCRQYRRARNQQSQQQKSAQSSKTHWWR